MQLNLWSLSKSAETHCHRAQSASLSRKVEESIGKQPLTTIIGEGCPLDCGRRAVAALRKLKGEPAASTMTSGSCLVLAVASRQSMVVTGASRTRSLAVLM